MKKLLNIIGASVILSSSAVVASCSLDPSAPIEINDAIDLQNFFNKLQNNRPELSSDYNVAFDGQNTKYIAALEEIFDQEKVVRTPFIQKLLKADFYDNDKSTIGYDIQKTGQVLGGGSLVRGADHKVIPDVANKKLSDYFYEKVAKPDEKPVDNRVDLATVITSKALGELSDNNDTTIMDAVKQANSELNVNEVEIKNITEESATVAAKSGSTIYSGSVTVAFSITPVNTTKPLTDDLTETILGELADKSESSIKIALTDKNKNLNVSQVTITDITDTGATVNVIKDSTVYDAGGSVDVTFTVTPGDTRKELSEVVKELKLGELIDKEPATILAAINKVNSSSLTDADVTIEVTSETEATVTPKDDSTLVKGDPVTVTFTVKADDTRDNLSDVVTELKLGELTDKEPATILAAINKVNSSSLTDADVTIEVTSETEATVTPKDDSTLVKGDPVTVTFTVKADDTRDNLSDVVTELKLGELTDKEPATILAAINKVNSSSLTDADVTIEVTSETEATVTPKDDSTLVKGDPVTVTFTVKADDTRDNLSDVVATLELGKIADKEPATILAAINEVNSSSLTDTDVTIEVTSETKATVTPKDDSTLVKGDPVNVSFTVDTGDTTVALDTIITDPDLGAIATADEDGVKAALTEKFGDLDQSQITITMGDDGLSATISANEGSTLYSGSVEVTFTLPEAPTMNYYSILNVHHLLANGPEYSYDDYTMTIMIGSEDLLNLDNNGYVYIPFTILPE
jgi:antitoxin (DNA-binding transcriptional repressor) of toxin-antitoxin stability system